MLPALRLAILLTKLANEHGSKLLHVGKVDLLTEDLGRALKKQQHALTDPGNGAWLTAYEVLPIVLEVKLLTTAVASRLNISTKGKKDIDVLEEIIAAHKAKGTLDAAKDVTETLEWTRKLFAVPEIQAILAMEMTEIERPKSITHMGRFFKQVAGRSRDEVLRLQQFLERTKKVDLTKQKKPRTKKNDPKK